MGWLGRLVTGAIVVLLATAGPVGAQHFNVVGGYGAGMINFGAFNPDAGEATELTLDPGLVFTVFGESLSAGGRAGLRLNGAFSQRPLEFAGDARNINTWLVDASVVLRPLPLAEGRLISPFVSAGGGVISYSLGRTGRPVVVSEANVVYPGNNERQWMLVGGAGIDVLFGDARLFGTPLGLRLEVANHVTLRSPFETFEGERLGPIHNLRFGASLIGVGWF
jgi:hypothetical protein